jgi:hypothetical protein
LPRAAFALITAITIAQIASATELIFEGDPGLPIQALDGTNAAQYGDRVTSTAQDGYFYGLAEGPTPNIIVRYGTNPDASTFHPWNTTGYGDLVNTVYGYGGPDNAVSEFSLIADPGYVVRLHSFDMGGYFFADRSISSLTILDGADNPLYSIGQTVIQGVHDGTAHTTFSFPTPLEASTIKIRVDQQVTPDTYVGFDNVVFSQAVPEPATVALAIASALALLFARRGRIR